jgi:hypothetical protein
VIFALDGSVKRVIKGKNIVTNGGDLYYAQKSVGETPTNDFTAGGLRLGSDNTAPAKGDTDVTTFIASTGKAEKSGYPKTNGLHRGGDSRRRDSRQHHHANGGSQPLPLRRELRHRIFRGVDSFRQS